MEPGVYLHYEKVQLWYLKWIGFILNLGKLPVHSCLYVKLKKMETCFKVELTSDPPEMNTRTVGRGDGYTVQVTVIPESEMKGERVSECAQLAVLIHAENYASTRYGDLTYSSAEREWYDHPQGYGGPMFDRNTCNTFTYYLLKNSLSKEEMPKKPIGAIGWGRSPKFPGPIPSPYECSA